MSIDDPNYIEWNHKRVKAIISHYSFAYFHQKRILDLGAGHGEVAASLARLGADVLCVDARQENLETITRKHPHLKTLRADLDNEWPFSGQQFDMVISLGLLCHLKNSDKHLRDICGVAEHIVLETEVLDSGDPNASVLIREDRAINDLSFNGEGNIITNTQIQNILSSVGATFKRKDDQNLNTFDMRYNWAETNIGRQEGNRRMYFIRRDPHLAKMQENTQHIQKAESVIIAQNNVRQLNSNTNKDPYTVAANRAAINTTTLNRAAANKAKYSGNQSQTVFYGKPVYTPPPQPPLPPMQKIRLFFNYYEDKNPERQKELDYCLQKNIDNTLLDIIILDSDNTPTYNFYFEKINQITGPNDINIICNSDIFFDDTIRLVSNMQTRDVYALSRWDWYGEGSVANHRAIKNSQDVWIIKGKVDNVDGSFCLGVPFCDNRIAFEFSRAGYKVSNPSRSIKSYHYHNSAVRKYKDNERVQGQYLFVEPTAL